jgi:membrane protease YdiL (CAAX protease family)
LVIVSAAFAVSHWHGPSLLPLFVLALGFGLAYELTGSLLAPIIMHAFFNSTMIIQLFYQRAHP